MDNKISPAPLEVFIEPTISVQEGTVELAELKERFNVWSTIGMAYALIATPLGIGSYLVFTLGVGGSPYFIYGYIFVAIMQLAVCSSLAEISAVFPHASGQIFWVAALAPPRLSRGLSYCNGAFTLLAWTFATTGCFVFTGQMFVAFATILNEQYQIQTYQVFLLAIASALLSLVFNIWLFNWIPAIAKFFVVFINAGTVYLFVALLVRAQPKATASAVFTEVVNETGWASKGLVFCLNVLPGSASVTVFDAAAHMAEELPHPEKQVPQVMIFTSLLCALGGFIMIIVYLFCTTNPAALLEPIGGQPIFQLFLDAFRSKPLLVIAALIFCAVFVFACISFVTTLSRVLWSFAKHHGTPFSNFLGHVHPNSQIPVNAVCVCTLVTALICLLDFGPALILNACFGASSICGAVSYGMPIWCLIFKGRGDFPEKRHYSMGKFGLLVNLVAVLWQIFQVIFLAFPLYYPVTSSNMNYASAVMGVGAIMFAINWVLHSRRRYEQPKPLFVAALHGDLTRKDA
ncbi:hypothetical protein AYO21_01476 [Fonsecaea monophora]|uniref:Amino acid permease/ SLC12A domain-containing protein n=1 Tax=Fonsecaea monophora TaxID=254056 RepID=A0A177FLL7_9EURO|nr:hypothetical protein AYO21_01476 [Fonsecaea monophora]KAH0847574.1 choline and nitrogen mustard permease [Fonsecaea pedrosoi]OAG44480.1 hypothetical protein AYO21_01476 [Fonsecaea monophora]